MSEIRAEFEKWLMDVHGLDSNWNEERNCFDDFPAHLAFKAWQAALAAPVTAPVQVRCYVSEMKTSAGSDYYVTVRYGDRELTPHMYKIKGRADYDVAEWKWIFGQGDKPDILTFDTDESLTSSTPQAPAEVVGWVSQREHEHLRKGNVASIGPKSYERVIPVYSPTPVTAAPVQVKALEWTCYNIDMHKAETFFGYYVVSASGQAWLNSGPICKPFEIIGKSIETAKAAAQADYEQRIRSALISGDTSNG